MKIKITGLVLAILMVALMFAACNPTQNNITEDDYKVNLNLDYEITATIKVGITPDAREDELINGLIEGFNEIFPNVTIEKVKIQGLSYYSALSGLYAADIKNPGTMPDIIWESCTESFKLISDDVFLNLDPYINAELEIDSTFLDPFYEEMWKLGQEKFDGSQYLIPRSADRVVTHINTKIFNDAGVNMNKVRNGWTWEDFLEVCQTIREYYDNNGMQNNYIVDAYINWEAVMYPILRSCGAKVFDESNNISINSQQTKEALELMRDLVDKRYVAPLNSQAQANYEGGQGAMMFHSAPASKFLKLLGDDYNLVTFPLIGDNPKIGTGIPGYAIYNKSSNRDLAWQFLKYLVSEDGQNALAKAGATNPPIRKDMADPDINEWGKDYTHLNMEAYTYKVEYNQVTDFFLSFESGKQSDLINAVADMITNYLSTPGMSLNTTIAQCEDTLNSVISRR